MFYETLILAENSLDLIRWTILDFIWCSFIHSLFCWDQMLDVGGKKNLFWGFFAPLFSCFFDVLWILVKQFESGFLILLAGHFNFVINLIMDHPSLKLGFLNLSMIYRPQRALIPHCESSIFLSLFCLSFFSLIWSLFH